VFIERRGSAATTDEDPTGLAAVPVRPAETAPEAVEFVRFCYRRCGVAWPDLYDEMCAVASRGAFKGLGYDELSDFGISFALPELPRMAAIAQRVVDEERDARGRPVLRAVLAATG
jgi:hypothetical protein